MHPFPVGRYIRGMSSALHPLPRAQHFNLTRPLQLLDLQLHCLSPRRPAEHPELYAEAYALWRQIWSDTMVEIGSDQALDCDDFARADEILVLCSGREAIGLALLQRFDPHAAAEQVDSCDHPCPPEALEQLAARGVRDLLVGRYFTLAPGFRKRAALPFSLKDLLLGAVVGRFLASGAQLLLGAMRDERGMQRLGYRFGAQLLCGGLSYHSAAVSLLQFQPADVRTALASPRHDPRMRQLWQRWGITS